MTKTQIIFRSVYALICLALMFFVFQSVALEGDTSALLGETHASLDCMQIGQWSECTGGGQFPLLQKIPSAALMVIGASDGLIIRFLAGVSVVSFFGILLLSWNYLKRKSKISAYYFLIVLVLSPFPWYARSSFGEMPSAWLNFVFFYACLRGKSKRGWRLYFLMLTACLAKEVAFPFLFVLGALGIYLSTQRVQWSRLIPLGAAAITAIAINTAHNYFRFGTLLNQSYVQTLHFVPDLGTHLSFFAGLFFSGNGGWVLFWPLAAIAILLGLIRGRGKARVSAIVTSVLLCGLVFGFSKWAYPFGWVCWGPRFLMPWIPVFVFAVMSSNPEVFEKMLKKLRGIVGTVLSAFLVLVSFPHALAIFSFTFVYSLFWPDSVCPKPVIIEQDAAYYFGCIEHYIWSKGSLLLQAYRFAVNEPGLDNHAIYPALLLVAVWIGLLFKLREEVNGARNHGV